MANTKSAAKRARQTSKRALQNRRTLTGVKSKLKKARADMVSGTKADAATALGEVSSALDKAANSGRLHRNAANRHKSRLNKALSALA